MLEWRVEQKVDLSVPQTVEEMAEVENFQVSIEDPFVQRRKNLWTLLTKCPTSVEEKVGR